MIEAALETEFEGTTLRNMLNAHLWPYGAYGNAKAVVRRALENAMGERRPETTPGDMISVSISLWDSGALPELLRKEIAAVERSDRALADQLSAQDKGQRGAYLGQLRSCLAAVEKARHD